MNNTVLTVLAVGVALYVITMPKAAPAPPPRTTTGSGYSTGNNNARETAQTIVDVLQGIYEGLAN